ncbi:hypothetical protein ACFYU5_08685 [Nocardia aobensis]|uniref:Uncharacterized protein n=1 Tax=Nocardia aobensis TaxID=257277 RepID=A0ABW6NZG3_9NOCA
MSETNSYPFVVDTSIESRLDSRTLDEVGRNLWPVDCQRCGRALGTELPALVVRDIGGIMAAASLNHVRCHAPEWVDRGVFGLPNENFLSYRTFGCAIAGESAGKPKPLPFGFVNPSLEQVMLHNTGSGWEIGTMHNYRDHHGLTGLALNKAVSGTRAVIASSDTVRVQLDKTAESWDFGVTSEILALIRQLRGIALGITTAYIPDPDFASGPGFKKALKSGALALGWVPLAQASST